MAKETTSIEGPLTWTRVAEDQSGKPDALSEPNQDTIAAVRALIRNKDRSTLLHELKSWSPEDVMELLVQLPLKPARKLFDWLPDDPTDKIVAELRPEFRAVIMADESIERLREIVERMSPEVAQETLAALPDEVEDRLIPKLRQADELAAAQSYRRDTAGRVMTRRLVALTADRTAASAVAEIQRNADAIRKLADIFIIDGERRVIGRLNANRLLLVPPEAKLGDIMDPKVVTVSAESDQEDAIRLAAKRKLRSLAVVDQAGRLIGQLTVRELEQIMRDEAIEDLMHISSLSADAKATDPVRRIVSGRLPWLLAGLVGAMVAALVIGSFEEQLGQAAILAAFIPVVMSLAGNSGLQASAVSVQAIATGEVWEGDIAWRFLRELAGALINGAVAGAILAALILVGGQLFDLEAPVRLALATSLSLLTVTTIAAMVGASVPLALDRVGIDPAAATGVFITTSNDVLGVMVFFLMATAFYFQ